MKLVKDINQENEIKKSREEAEKLLKLFYLGWGKIQIEKDY